MTPFIYCSINPEQRQLGELICKSYDGFRPIPLYDTACMSGDEGVRYLSGEFGKIKESTVALLHSHAIKEAPALLEGKQCFVFGGDNLVDLDTSFTRVVSNNSLARDLDGESIVLPYFASSPTTREHYWKFDSRMEVRVLIPGEAFSHTPYLSIFEGLESSGINFRLIINNPVDYGPLGNELTNEQLKELLPEDQRITYIKGYPPEAADIVISPTFRQAAYLHTALEVGALIIAHKTRVAADLRTRYGCLIDCNLEEPVEVGEAVRALKDSSADYSKLTAGINSYNGMRSKEQIKSLYDPIFGSKKGVNRVSPVRGAINVFLMLRNNETTMGATLAGLKSMERRFPNNEFQYYFYENDSDDDTPNLIADFFTHSNGSYICEKLGKRHWAGSTDPRRMLDLATYRNKMVNLCSTWEFSTYSFIIDSEIEFPLDIMEKQIYTLQSYPDAVMVTPYGQPQHENGYYDTYAYRGMDYPNDPPPKDAKAPFEVKSAFSGFACIYSSVLQECHWDCTGSESEHIHFCNMVGRYGKILVDPDMEVRWRK